MAEQGKTPFHIEVLEDRVGTVVKGKWTIERLIGVGGTAAVYEGRHEIGRLDALKILHPDFAGDDTLVARFRREAEAVNRVDHPGVAEVRDIEATEEGIPFLVMELLEGESVSAILHRNGKLEVEPALDLIEQLLAVLIAAHGQHVIHRDIKPSNLFIDDKDRLRVLDFGVARVLVPTGKALTEAGTTLGTLQYMPPEQLKRSDVDHRADLYAVGATLREMVTGQRVHEAESRQALATLILKEPAKTMVGLEDDIPDDLGKVVDRALAFLPERRYPDAATMQADLRAVRRGEAPSYADARLEAGDDPRDKKPPKPAPAKQKADKTKAETPRSTPPTVTEGGTERMAVPADEAPTRKRTVVDDDETTHVRKTAGSERPATARATGATAAKDDEDRPRPYGWLVVIAAAALALWWATGKDDVETDLPTTELPSATASVSSAPPESEGEGGALPREDVEASASAPVSADPPAASSATPAAEKPPATPVGKPTPKPVSSSEPGKSDAGFPFPFPSGFPTTIPTSLPSSLPFPLPSAPPAPTPTP